MGSEWLENGGGNIDGTRAWRLCKLALQAWLRATGVHSHSVCVHGFKAVQQLTWEELGEREHGEAGDKAGEGALAVAGAVAGQGVEALKQRLGRQRGQQHQQQHLRSNAREGAEQCQAGTTANGPPIAALPQPRASSTPAASSMAALPETPALRLAVPSNTAHLGSKAQGQHAICQQVRIAQQGRGEHQVRQNVDGSRAGPHSMAQRARQQGLRHQNVQAAPGGAGQAQEVRVGDALRARREGEGGGRRVVLPIAAAAAVHVRAADGRCHRLQAAACAP